MSSPSPPRGAGCGGCGPPRRRRPGQSHRGVPPWSCPRPAGGKPGRSPPPTLPRACPGPPRGSPPSRRPDRSVLPCIFRHLRRQAAGSTPTDPPPPEPEPRSEGPIFGGDAPRLGDLGVDAAPPPRRVRAEDARRVPREGAAPGRALGGGAPPGPRAPGVGFHFDDVRVGAAAGEARLRELQLSPAPHRIVGRLAPRHGAPDRNLFRPRQPGHRVDRVRQLRPQGARRALPAPRERA
jgi:hypothetical protein